MTSKKKRSKSSHLRFTPFLWLVLSLSVGFNIYLLTLVNTHTPSISKINNLEKPTSFLNLNAPVSCENEELSEFHLPNCPQSSLPVILPRYYPLHSIFIGYEKGIEGTGVFQTVFNIASQSQPRIPVMVVVPRSQMEDAKKELGSYGNESNKDLIRLIYAPSKYTIWIQDYYKSAIDGFTGKQSILDLPYENSMGEHVPTAIALACNSNLISQPGLDEKSLKISAGNYGGNIEALTDQLIVIGNTMSPEQKQVLQREISQKLVEIDVAWLKVGHVDELISIIPVKDRSKNCGFDLFYASPGKALELLHKESMTTTAKPLVFRHGFGKQISQFDLLKCFSQKSKHAGCVDILNVNNAYQKIIAKNLKKIQSQLANQSPSCREVKFQPIPVLFTSLTKQDKFGTDKDKAFTIEPNPINNVLLGNNLLLPKQNLGVFHKYTSEVFQTYGLKTTFVDAEYVHQFGGGIHCSVNTRHSCRPVNSLKQ